MEVYVKYIIGSGWWCSLDIDQRQNMYGAEEIRGLAFHQHWLKSVKDNTNPERIYIVDSNSPIKPVYDEIIDVTVLNENGGHSTNIRGKYCGWMRSVIHSMSYAQNCDCDYYVYIEQDVLLKGNGIIEHCISKMRKPYMFGKCKDFHNPLQQSFFIIRKDAIDAFLARIYLITYDDYQISPEKKFALATSPFFLLIPKILFVAPKNKIIKKLTWRIQNVLARLLGNYDYLPVGYGRDRPLDMGSNFLYFQHGTKEELKEYYDN